MNGPAYIFKRFFAFAIDFLLLAVIIKALFPYISYQNSLGKSYISTEIGILAYYVFFLSQDIFMKKTIGKYILKLEITFDNTYKTEGYSKYFRIITRRAFDLFELVCPFIYIFTIALTKKNQKPGDLISKIIIKNNS